MESLADPVIERARARVGKTLIEKWRLDKLLGVGGMAAVYAATHRNGMRVGIKMLHSELSVHAEVRSRFLREGYVANKVEHPGAVAVLDDEVTDDGDVFLVMELLEGENLTQYWERKGRGLAVERVLLIADQMLDVLGAAHAKSIVHRDIKPDNVFLTRSGVVKLLDFGIARLRELSDPSDATRTGSLMGTPAYMAPEQARARWDEVDARTDLWAVGATMFRLITGHPVHEAQTVSEQLLAAMTNPAASLVTTTPGIPMPVAHVVDKALAYDRNARWSDAHAMREAICDAFEAVTGSPVQASDTWMDSEDTISPDRTSPGSGGLRARAHWTRPGTTLSVDSHSNTARGSHGTLGWWLVTALVFTTGAFLLGYFGLRTTPPARLAAMLSEGVGDASTLVPSPVTSREAKHEAPPPSAEPSAAPSASATDGADDDEEEEEDVAEPNVPARAEGASSSPSAAGVKPSPAPTSRQGTAKPAPRKDTTPTKKKKTRRH